LAAGWIASAQVVVTWQAATTNGLGDAAGTPLPAGSLLRLGTFNLSNATIQANAGNYAFLNANFVLFDSTTIGTGVDGIDGYWSRVSPSGSTSALRHRWRPDLSVGLQRGQRPARHPAGHLYVIAGNVAVPSNTSVPNTTQIDLNEVDRSSWVVSARAVVRDGEPAAAIQPGRQRDSEPSTYGVVVGGAALVLAGAGAGANRVADEHEPSLYPSGFGLPRRLGGKRLPVPGEDARWWGDSGVASCSSPRAQAG